MRAAWSRQFSAGLPARARSGSRLRTIFKLCRASEWEEAERSGTFLGSPVDLRDGYIHFSTAEQVVDTAARHFAGVDGLTLLAVDADTLGSALKWEPVTWRRLVPAPLRSVACCPSALGAVAAPGPCGSACVSGSDASSRPTRREGHHE